MNNNENRTGTFEMWVYPRKTVDQLTGRIVAIRLNATDEKTAKREFFDMIDRMNFGRRQYKVAYNLWVQPKPNMSWEKVEWK